MEQIAQNTITAHYQPCTRTQYETLGDIQTLTHSAEQRAQETVAAARTKAAHLLWNSRAKLRAKKAETLLALETHAGQTLTNNAQTLARTLMQQSAELACGLAEKIIGHTLQFDKSFITTEIQKALRTIPVASATTLCVSSSDIKELQHSFAPRKVTHAFGLPATTIRPDESCAPGEAHLRTATFELHVSWKHCFKKLQEKLFSKFMAQEEQVAMQLRAPNASQDAEIRRAA